MKHVLPGARVSMPRGFKAHGTYHPHEVALLLGYRNGDHFMCRVHENLVKNHNFPARLPGLYAFSAPLVNRWIETNGFTLDALGPDAGLLDEAFDDEARP
jgi:hypothetical protein